ncbi:hypothetical protein CSQ80_03935 [Cyanobacterium aponinum IPPAS B-1201]|nr:hypothetical protein CSQ80_03935 [Cyanobacterium aponinum IPPAS B-1201]
MLQFMKIEIYFEGIFLDELEVAFNGTFINWQGEIMKVSEMKSYIEKIFKEYEERKTYSEIPF